ncbi:hypothetical protein F5884DRAFT_873315 [Xylogone sp. PMI_703]|nr:hypothetical protein F5884DRAFT_873315 [Xylogone sp. PMI_703]
MPNHQSSNVEQEALDQVQHLGGLESIGLPHGVRDIGSYSAQSSGWNKLAKNNRRPAGSRSSFKASHPLRHPWIKPNSVPHGAALLVDGFTQDELDYSGPDARTRGLLSKEQDTSPNYPSLVSKPSPSQHKNKFARPPKTPPQVMISKPSKMQTTDDFASSPQAATQGLPQESKEPYDMTPQRKTIPTSYKELVEGVKKIYASLLEAEKNCIAAEEKCKEIESKYIKIDRVDVDSFTRHKFDECRQILMSGIDLPLDIYPRHHPSTRRKLKRQSRAWCQAEPFPVSPSAKPQENKRKVLRIHINGKEHLCCPDSGSSKNIISKAFASGKRLKIHQQSKDIKRFQMGSGKNVWSVGRVYLHIKIPGLPFKWKKRSFYVLEGCPVPIVIGMPLLGKAEIHTKNRHLLETCPADWSNISQFLWIGSPRNRLNCSLGGHDLVAIADTGSDLNLMSLECAKKKRFDIDTRPEVRRRVRVGDGTEVETIGRVYIYNMEFDWRKPETSFLEAALSTTSTPFSPSTLDESNTLSQVRTDSEEIIVFDVIKGLPSDIVFGRDLLEATDAFNRCPDLLGRSRNDRNNDYEFNVFIDRGPLFSRPRFLRRRREEAVAAPETKEQHDDKKWAEFCRRTQEEDRIVSLPQDEQTGAREIEQAKIQAWNELHVNCAHCSPV